MNRKKLSGRKLFLLIWLGVIVLLLVGIAVLSKLNPTEHTESVKEAMRDGVLHEVNKINFLGIEVNPAVLSAYIVTGIILLAAVLIRIIFFTGEHRRTAFGDNGSRLFSGPTTPQRSRPSA